MGASPQLEISSFNFILVLARLAIPPRKGIERGLGLRPQLGIPACILS